MRGPSPDELTTRGVRLSLGGHVYDSTDPMGKMFFSVLAVRAEFEVDLLLMRTREGMAVALHAEGYLTVDEAAAEKGITRQAFQVRIQRGNRLRCGPSPATRTTGRG